MSDLRSRVDSWFTDLAARMQADADRDAAPEGEKLTVRQLLGRFDYVRRGSYFVSVIRERLEAHGLRTSPDFEFEYVENSISIELAREKTKPEWIDPTVRVGALPAAHNKPVYVAPDNPLAKAATLMGLNDYSQLPVMTSEREVKGMINWRSMGEAYAGGNSPEFVRECMENHHEIGIDMILADATDYICRHDCVLVRGEDKEITGIVTAADLALQFKKNTHPFLLVGEIEHHLRNFVRGKFTVNELKEVADGSKEILGPDDLTFGGYCRLIEIQKNWERLGLSIDRVSFLDRINKVRYIRNEIVHFSADDVDPSDVDCLHKTAQLCRKIVKFQQPNR